MATNSRFKTRGIRVYGPGGVEFHQADFTTSGTTADVTVTEAQGLTVARTGVGLFTVTLAKTPKAYTATFSVQGSTTAQVFKIDSRTANAFVIKQVTAGGDTGVDTLAARINVQVMSRTSS